MTRKTTCDAQGNFAFTEVADGSYYVATYVTWETGGRYTPVQGGGVMTSVTVKGGQTIDVIIAPN